MADLISRAAAIDAIVSVTAFPDSDYIKNLCENPANSEDWLGGVCDAINAVEEVNAVDAVPVVRCRDCKHWVCADVVNGVRYGDCTNGHSTISRHAMPNENYYCADGERRDDDGRAEGGIA